ncbi:glycosyl hydrolase family 28-related protein [Pelagicoccus enzymogenes]|uniref:glycosyl hydrolase family 28-related protein n=1 Tax=Pelagicoccus enzymogenes TaxID=2773457 RepID=UPI00280CA0BA|nr:glycosyl hydrolase family 28-related protein [Pelagicoccus enzymogenes]MDQ8197707.1 glycosyl hydrolase family 28-related protein [Pelagicoccus enzymogenes]
MIHNLRTLIAVLAVVAMPIISWGQGERLSVRDFGAKGDGVNDDTSGIAKAIVAGAKKGRTTIVFPAGLYLTDTILVESGLTLYVDKGATLIWKTGAKDSDHKSLISILGKEDIKVEGEGALQALSPSGLLQVVDSERVVIRGLRLETLGSTGDGITLTSSTEVSIESCSITGGGQAIGISDSSNVRISQLGATSEKGLVCRRVKDIELVDVRIDSQVGPQFLIMESSAVHLDGIGSQERSSESIVSAHDVQDLLLTNCQAVSGTKTFLQILGSQSRGIVARGNDLSQSRAPVMVGPDVPEGRVEVDL